MVVVPLSKPANESSQVPVASMNSAPHWIRYAAAGTLAASGVLLVTGRRKEGLLTAVAGTSLVLIDQQEVVRAWWDKLPVFLEDMYELLGRAQEAVEDVSAQGKKLGEMLGR